MSSKHSAKSKANIALEALSLSENELDTLAEKHGVTKSEIKTWVKDLKKSAATVFSEEETGSHHHHAPGEDVTIETEDEDLYRYVQHGVHEDKLNYKKLTFWSVLGTALVIIIIALLIPFSQMTLFNAKMDASENSTPLEIRELRAQDEETLNSFGVVDLENDIYRIPIDSAISKIVAQ